MTTGLKVRKDLSAEIISFQSREDIRDTKLYYCKL